MLAAGGLAYALAQTMIVPALPEIQRTFGGDPADATWLLTAFLLTAAVATPLLGRLGDMYGKEHWLLISLGVLRRRVGRARALAGSLGVMIAGRAIQGAGGAIFPLAIGIIRDEFPREKVATGIGTISAMFGIGGGVGLVVAGVLVDGIGVAWIFWLSAAAAVARRVRDVEVRPRVARARRGADRLDRRRAAVRRARARCCSASARATRGAGPRPACSACSPRPWPDRDLGRVGAAGRRPARRPAAHAPPRRCGRRTSPPSRSASRCSARSC